MPDGFVLGRPNCSAAALDGITGAHVDWADSKGLNEWERKALELSEDEASSPQSAGRGPSR